MQNPILQMLSGNKQQNQNSYIDRIKMAKSIISGKDPNQICKNLMNINPEFKRFVEANESKSIEDIAMEYDIDLDMLKKYM